MQTMDVFFRLVALTYMCDSNNNIYFYILHFSTDLQCAPLHELLFQLKKNKATTSMYKYYHPGIINTQALV